MKFAANPQPPETTMRRFQVGKRIAPRLGGDRSRDQSIVNFRHDLLGVTIAALYLAAEEHLGADPVLSAADRSVELLLVEHQQLRVAIGGVASCAGAASVRGSGRNVTVQAESSSEARGTVRDIGGSKVGISTSGKLNGLRKIARLRQRRGAK